MGEFLDVLVLLRRLPQFWPLRQVPILLKRASFLGIAQNQFLWLSRLLLRDHVHLHELLHTLQSILKPKTNFNFCPAHPKPESNVHANLNI
jgi:hypothetical protein